MSQAELPNQINQAIGAHGAWKLRLRTAINTGACDIAPATASSDNQCAFGKWLHGPTVDATTRAGVPYQVIRRLHAEFHQTAGKVLTKAVAGDTLAAQKILDSEFNDQSEKLVRALHKWKREAA